MVRPMPQWWPEAPESVRNAAIAFREFCNDLELNSSLSWLCRRDKSLGYMLGEVRLPGANRHLVALARAYEAADAIAECRAEELRLGSRTCTVATRLCDSISNSSNSKGLKKTELYDEALMILESFRIESEAEREQRRCRLANGDAFEILNAVKQLRSLSNSFSSPGPREKVTEKFFVHRLAEIYGLITKQRPVFTDSRKLDQNHQFYKVSFIDYLRRAFATVGLPRLSSFDHLLREYGGARFFLAQLIETSQHEIQKVHYASLPSTRWLINYSLREFYRPGQFPPARKGRKAVSEIAPQ
mgnify:FL=1